MIGINNKAFFRIALAPYFFDLDGWPWQGICRGNPTLAANQVAQGSLLGWNQRQARRI
jgi:hypothetical protein